MNDYLVRLARDFLLSTYLPSIGTYATSLKREKKEPFCLFEVLLTYLPVLRREGKIK